MNELRPLARAFIEQAVQSASMHHKHRAQLWAQLQLRVLAESSRVSPSQSPIAGVLRLVLRTPLGWAGSVVVSGALLVGVVGATHRPDPAARAAVLEACPPAPTPSREACLAPVAPTNASLAVLPPTMGEAPKQTKKSRLKPSKPTAKPPPNRVATLPPLRDLQAIVVEPSRGLPRMAPVHARVPYELDFAPHLVGGISPLWEGQFEPPAPLRLTQPRLRLTSTVLE